MLINSLMMFLFFASVNCRKQSRCDDGEHQKILEKLLNNNLTVAETSYLEQHFSLS